MVETTLEQRKEAAKKVIKYMLAQNLTPSETVRQSYNNAIDDVVKAIDTYIQKNPQHALPFKALQEDIKSWMPLPFVEP